VVAEVKRLAAVALAAVACAPPGEPPELPIPGPPAAPYEDPPADLVVYVTGSEADAEVEVDGPAALLMGGGPEVDAGFVEWAARAAGGDVVVIRASGADGYNDYLFTDIGGFDSVETILVDDRAKANSGYVAHRLRSAEAIWIAGGDQSVYLASWRGTLVERELNLAWSRGALLGGTSAGCVVLGGHVFAATNGSVTSAEALEDPFNEFMTLEGALVEIEPLANVLCDTHFFERDRMGRMIAFLARLVDDGAEGPVAIGVDENTGVVVEADGRARVIGSGAVSVVVGDAPADVLEAGGALDVDGYPALTLRAGEAFDLGALDLSGASAVGAEAGATVPADPY
jgi:cyanophycinase